MDGTNTKHGNKKTKSSQSKQHEFVKLKAIELHSTEEESTRTDTDSSESSANLLNESFQPTRSSSEESEEEFEMRSRSGAHKRRKIKSSLKENKKRAKEQKTSESKLTENEFNKVVMEVFRMNTELAELSKSVAIFEQNISLYENFAAVSAQSVYTLENLPTFPIATNINHVQSGNDSVGIPVNTVEEAHKLNKILEDKVANEDMVSSFNVIGLFEL